VDQVEKRLGATATVPRLIALLGDRDPAVRRLAAAALWELGPDARAAVDALTLALKDKDEEVRTNAAGALAALGHAARPAVPLLIQRLQDENWAARSNAAGALGAIGPDAREAVPALRKALGDPDGWVVRSVIEALGSMGPAASEAVPDLARLVEQHASTEAARALGKMGRGAKGAVSALTKRLDADDPRAHKGPDAEFWRQENGHARVAAALALWQADRQAKALPVLLGILEDKDKAFGGNLFHVRESAAEALGEVGPDAKAAVPLLVPLLKDENFRLRLAAVQGLGGIGRADAEHTVAALRSALRDPVSDIGEAAAEALGRMGPLAREAASDLRPFLNRGPGDRGRVDGLSVAAAEASWKITHDAGLSVPTLVEALGVEEERFFFGPNTVRRESCWGEGNPTQRA
jgi:HEAT repeat protein